MRIKKFFLIFLLALTVSLTFFNQAESFKEAFFKDVQFNPKVYDGEPVLINVIIKNAAVNPALGEPKFFLTVFADNNLVYDEASQPWVCPLNNEASKKILVSNLKGPKEYLMRIELYWLNESVAIQEDVYQFKIVVVKLFIEDWGFSGSEVQAGAENFSVLKISFRNGGNDEMVNASIKVSESSSLIVTPSFKALGSLKPKEKLEESFLVSAPLTIELGIHQLTFQVSYFDFRGVFHIEDFNIQVKVVKLKAKIEVYTPLTVKYKNLTTVTVKLKDGNNNPVSNANINFYLNSKFLGVNSTNNNGEASLTFNADFKPGVYEVKIEYSGSKLLEASTASANLTIDKALTKIFINTLEAGKVNKETLIKVNLTDEYNNPVSKASVKLYAENQILESLTNDFGEAEFNYKPLAKGKIQLKALYEGNENYSSSYALSIITVEPIKTRLNLIAQQFLQGNQIKVKAVLKDEFNNPVSNASLKFTFLLNEKPIYEEASLTNNDGEASLTCKLSSTGFIKVKVDFQGSEKFSESSASTSIYPSAAILFIISLTSTAAIATILLYAKKFNLFGKIESFIKEKTSKPSLKTNKNICIRCGLEIPKNALYCNKCGANQFPYASTLSDLDKKVLDYIASHGGSISINKAVEDLGLTKESLLEAIERLKKAGKLEPVE
ncbi:Ig-like domain repeat protein [Candidatus Bathyarchaeota archaeon]|nr:Ig-like domain repeat protein [Candidatus Bathyarchaeota archaeon]